MGGIDLRLRVQGLGFREPHFMCLFFKKIEIQTSRNLVSRILKRDGP